MSDLVDRWQASDGSWLEMRLMRASDEAQVKESLNQLSASARRSRFFASIAEFSDAAVHKFVTVDPGNEYLLVVVRRDQGVEIPIAGGRFVHQEAPSVSCDFSLLISDPWQGQGIGRRVLRALLREASRRGLQEMHGQVLAENRPMLKLARSQHFVIDASADERGVLRVVRDVPAAAPGLWQGLLRRLGRKQAAPIDP